MNDTPNGPYGQTALHYLPEWSPIPIWTFEGNKRPMVKGHHGYPGAYVTPAQARSWIASGWVHPGAGLRFREAQIALRLPKNVIGLDVDRYAGKAGGRTLATLEAKWGKLPRTWWSSSRADGSGIHLYRVPEGTDVSLFRNPAGTFSDGAPMGGIDIIHWGLRYATVWPSRHGREGGRFKYLWFNPDGEAETDDQEVEVPLPEDLAELGEGFITGLSTGRAYAPGETELGASSADDWLRARPNGDGPLCAAMQRNLDRWIGKVQQAGVHGGCYPAVNQAIKALVGDAAEGHAGAYLAISTLWYEYRNAMNRRTTDKRDANAVETEFRNSLRGAIEGLPKKKYRDTDEICELAEALA